MSTEFAVFVPGMKHFDALALAKLMIDNLKRWLEDTLCMSAKLFYRPRSSLPYILYGEREAANPQRGMAINMRSYHASQPFLLSCYSDLW